MIRLLGSIRFALILILIVTLFVIAGTILESLSSSHLYAAYWTYQNPLFHLLLVLFFINILCAALTRWPFQIKHIPFLITHLGLLMVIAGTLAKGWYGTQGNMELIEGTGSDEIVLPQTYALTLEKKGIDPWHPEKNSWAVYPGVNVFDSSHQIQISSWHPHHESQFFTWIDGKKVDLEKVQELIVYDQGYRGYAIETEKGEKPLCRRYTACQPSLKLEELRPLIVVSIDGEIHPVGFDPGFTTVKVPILNGQGLLSFNPRKAKIPYRLRLRQARQINYPNTNQPFSYECDLQISDQNGEETLATISMNHVYQTWDGYRFYLANLQANLPDRAGRVQIVVNHDPAKYLLTYPGGLLATLGIVLLFAGNRIKSKE